MGTERKMVDSGVEWIGEVPEGWEINRLSEVFHSHKRGATPAYLDESDFKIVNQACLSSYRLDTSKAKPATPMIGQRGRFSEGDLLVASTGGGVMGKCALATMDGYCDSHVTILKPVEKISALLVFYWMSASFEWIQQFGKGSTNQIELQVKPLLTTAFPLPPINIQRSIATFLDHHVDLIDRERELIAQKVGLLKDKRKALIFECVTGKRTIVEAQHLAGVDDWSDIVGSGPLVAVPTPGKDDPFVKGGRLVDSGVEWIGEVPEGWEIVRIGTHCSMKAGKSIPAESLVPSGFPVFGSNGIRGYSKEWICVGDYWLIGRQGSAGEINRATGKFWPAEHALVVTHNRHVNHGYLGYQLLAANLPQYIGGTAQPGLSASFISQVPVPLPSLPMQVEIATFLDHQVGLIDREIELLETKSSLLADKRKALIFEAVTGKLDCTQP